MREKWCSCRHVDGDICYGRDPRPLPSATTCLCACHRAEARPVEDVEADLRKALKGRGDFRVDRAATPQGPSFFTVKDKDSEILIEYEPREGFGLTLVGWGEHEDRAYKVTDVVKQVKYWLDGMI